MANPPQKSCCPDFDAVHGVTAVIAAPLQQMLEKGNALTKMVYGFDLLAHLAFWIAALIIEILNFNAEDRGSDMLKELANFGFWTLVVAIANIFIAYVAGGFGQDPGLLFPTTYAAIVGGALSSIAFNILWIIQSESWNAMAKEYTDDDTNDDNKLKYQRWLVLWAMTLKIFAVITLKKNASFWAPLTPKSYYTNPLP